MIFKMYVLNYLFGLLISVLFYSFLGLLQLRQAANARRYLALRPGTHANHISHLLSFLRFCLHFQLTDLPASTDTLSVFAEFLLQAGRAPNSVLNTLSSLKFVHLVKGCTLAGFESFNYRLLRLAIPKSVSHIPIGANPIEKETLNLIVVTALRFGEQGLAFACLCLVAFYTMARLSSLVPLNAHKLDLQRTLLLSDVKSHNDGFNICIKWGKTDQPPTRGIVVPIVKTHNLQHMCPVLFLSKMLKNLKGCNQTATPLFAWSTRTFPRRVKFFTVNTARWWLHRILGLLNKSELGYTFHSFRKGSCQLAYNAGANVGDIKFMGNWRSDAINQYLPADSARRRTSEILSNA